MHGRKNGRKRLILCFLWLKCSVSVRAVNAVTFIADNGFACELRCLRECWLVLHGRGKARCACFVFNKAEGPWPAGPETAQLHGIVVAGFRFSLHSDKPFCNCHFLQPHVSLLDTLLRALDILQKNNPSGLEVEAERLPV